MLRLSLENELKIWVLTSKNIAIMRFIQDTKSILFSLPDAEKFRSRTGFRLFFQVLLLGYLDTW